MPGPVVGAGWNLGLILNSMKMEAESEESQCALSSLYQTRIYNKISNSDAKGRPGQPLLRDRGLIGPTLTLRRGKYKYLNKVQLAQSVLEKTIPANILTVEI